MSEAGECKECARLRQALVDICSPMEAVLRGYSEEERRQVNGSLLALACNSVGFIQDIARKALEKSP